MPLSHERPTPIAIAVVERDDRFLVGRRADGAVLGGMSEFPGGKMLAGETPAEAAARECLEETGISISVEGLLARIVHRYDHGTVDLHFLKSAPRQDHPTPRVPYRWVARAELGELDFPEANGPVIKLLRRSLPGT